MDEYITKDTFENLCKISMFSGKAVKIKRQLKNSMKYTGKSSYFCLRNSKSFKYSYLSYRERRL